jgi:AraC-like DNA-binding protein
MRICTELELAASLLHRDVGLTVTVSGRHQCGAEWVVGPRVIREHLMYYVVGPGTIRLQSGAKEFFLQPETFFWLQPGVPHTFTVADGALPAEVVFFRFFLGARNKPLRLRASWVQRSLEPELGARLEALLPEHLPDGETRPLTLRYQLGALLAWVVARSDADGVGRNGFSRQQKEAVLAFLRARLSRRFTMREAARQVALNPDYFSRQFRKTFGISPQAWITRARIHRAAAQLLETDMRVKQIAAGLGYDDLYFFSRQFKGVMGRSPRNYRLEKGRAAAD